MNLLEQEQRRQARKIRFFKWAVAFFVTIVLINTFTNKKPSEDSTVPYKVTSEDTNEKVAVLINLHGELCAKITSIKNIRDGVREVSCIRYRDGTGNVTYEVDLKSNSVK